MVRLVLELIEQFIVLVFLELKLAALEIKRNMNSARNGAVLLGMGAFLLLFAVPVLVATAVAALALALPVWFAALIMAVVLLFVGAAFLMTGLSKVKHFTVVPTDTLDRVESISKKLKKHAEQHGHV
ncbi:MAG: hypothetical protein A2075_07805 [Geobacteraceae bacterium GWC2_58_44]|nr:MAG: hypothetical protein A2075_07805 [Geobacteraceae bacterium GWC2_58_44]